VTRAIAGSTAMNLGIEYSQNANNSLALDHYPYFLINGTSLISQLTVDLGAHGQQVQINIDQFGSKVANEFLWTSTAPSGESD
jgi:hypothetical protein